jgi:FkbM family methyltransferase
MPTIRQSIVAQIARRYPFLRGGSTIASSHLLGYLAGRQGGLAWASLDNGSWILVPLDDYVGRAVYYIGDLDRKVTRVIQRIVNPGDVVLDIGANLGLVTMQLAHLVGRQGRVHAFEPNPVMVDLVRRTLQRCALGNVSLHAVGLGSELGNLELAVPINNAGRASMRQSRWKQGVKKIVVPVQTLASFIQTNSIEKVRLVKIDVEGFEMEVLRGAESWIAHSPPDFVLFESNEIVGSDVVDPVMVFLAEMGYRIYAIDNRMLFLSLSTQSTTEPVTSNAHDFLAVHSGCEMSIDTRFRVRRKR